MGVCRGRIYEWYIGVKVQACVTWSSAKGTESPDLGMYCNNQACVASCIVIRAPFGQFVANRRIMIRGSGASVLSCLLELSLSHGAISLHATLRHQPLVTLFT